MGVCTHIDIVCTVRVVGGQGRQKNKFGLNTTVYRRTVREAAETGWMTIGSSWGGTELD